MARKIVFVFFVMALSQGIRSSLDVMMSGKELQRLLFDSKDDFKIVEDGKTSKFLQQNLSSILPPIQPKFTEFEIQFSSAKRLYYEMQLNSSDTSIMYEPTVTIPYRGRLQKKWIAFKIRFPCTKAKSGEVTLGVIIDFFYNRKRTHLYKRLDLSAKRLCKSGQKKSHPNQLGGETDGCRKRCDLSNFTRKFCLSDWVARVKVTKSMLNSASSHYLVRVPRKTIFKAPNFSQMAKRNQVIESRGTAVTCDCTPLQEGVKYLVFGKESFETKSLYVDDYSIAFPIHESDKDAAELIRTFRTAYRQIKCPPKLWQYRYFGRNLFQ